ncbi:unnamed protein product [Urochloa humidicola]
MERQGALRLAVVVRSRTPIFDPSATWSARRRGSGPLQGRPQGPRREAWLSESVWQRMQQRQASPFLRLSETSSSSKLDELAFKFR